MKLFSFRNFRILLLLILLATAAIYTKAQRLGSTAWLESLPVVIFPINGDGSQATADYIQGLGDGHFAGIDAFTARQGKKYRLLTARPTQTRLGPEVGSHPPAPPPAGANVLSTMLWSLKLRYWAWQNTPDEASNTNRVRIFVIYHQGKDNQPLAHSLGMQKGLLGVVHAFAIPRQNAQNNIVIAHEFLHTVGALDKYGPGGQPVFPQGYAHPQRDPLYPQYRAEIMAGRIPLSSSLSKMAQSLRSTVVGEETAREIAWITD